MYFDLDFPAQFKCVLCFMGFFYGVFCVSWAITVVDKFIWMNFSLKLDSFVFLSMNKMMFQFYFLRSRYIDALRRVIESAVERNASRNAPDPNAAIHDMAFYPLCKSIWKIYESELEPNISIFDQFTGSKNNQTSWLEENTAKLYFSTNIFDKLVPNTYLHRATLRFVIGAD